MEYRPTFQSLIGSIAYGLSPLGSAGLVTYFLRNSGAKWLWIAFWIMAAFSLLLTLQALLVHRACWRLDEIGIHVLRPGPRQSIAWADVVNATLRERHNTMTRTDRMLVIQSKTSTLFIHPSILSPAQEKEMLEVVRSRIRVVVQRDTPSI